MQELINQVAQRTGLAPDKDTKVVPMAFPVIGDAVRTGKVSAGTFVEPFYSAEMAKGGLRKLFTAVEAVGYEHELLDIFFGEKFLKANPDAVRAFLQGSLDGLAIGRSAGRLRLRAIRAASHQRTGRAAHPARAPTQGILPKPR